jgi:hypothetical protein
MVVVGLLTRKRDEEFIKPQICDCPRFFSCQLPSKANKSISLTPKPSLNIKPLLMDNYFN